VTEPKTCVFAVSRSERTRWIQAVTPLSTDGDNERIYEAWGMCILFIWHFVYRIPGLRWGCAVVNGWSWDHDHGWWWWPDNTFVHEAISMQLQQVWNWNVVCKYIIDGRILAFLKQYKYQFCLSVHCIHQVAEPFWQTFEISEDG